MLIGENIRIYNVTGITDQERVNIIEYLKKEVRSWVKTDKNKWFTARDLIGENKINWIDTPLIILYNHQINKGKSIEEAHTQAGREAGHLLKKALFDDTFNFETRTGYRRSYCCKDIINE